MARERFEPVEERLAPHRFGNRRSTTLPSPKNHNPSEINQLGKSQKLYSFIILRS